MPSPLLRFSSPATVVWRADGVLQVGLDRQRSVVLDDAPADADVALRCFGRPRTPAQIGTILPCLDLAWLNAATATLRRHSIIVEAQPALATALVLGAGPLADECAAALALLPGADVRQAPDSRIPGWLDGRTPVVVAGRTVEPDRRLLGDLVGRHQPHLVVRAEPERVVVGPFVEVGRVACVRCSDLVRRDLDVRWPYVLAQLCRMQYDPDRVGSAWASATVAAQVRAHLAGRAPQSAGASIELSTHDHAVGIRPWRPHPECGCAWGVQDQPPATTASSAGP